MSGRTPASASRASRTTSRSPRRCRSRRGSATPAARRRAAAGLPRGAAYGAPLYGAGRDTAVPAAAARAPPPPAHARDAATRRDNHESVNAQSALTRVVLFTAMCLVFMFVLVTVFGQFRFDARATYSAVFTNVSGLKGGNFVRIAGVEVGKVRNMTLHKDGTVTVEFAIDKSLTLTEGTKAAVRYENLIGDRYLSLEEGAGSVRKLQPGQTIPLARTSPALDVDALHRRLPAAVPRAGSRSGQRVVRRTAEGVPGPGRHHLVGAVPDLGADEDAGRPRSAHRPGHHQPEHRAGDLRRARRPVLRRPGQAVRARRKDWPTAGPTSRPRPPTSTPPPARSPTC